MGHLETAFDVHCLDDAQECVTCSSSIALIEFQIEFQLGSKQGGEEPEYIRGILPVQIQYYSLGS